MHRESHECFLTINCLICKCLEDLLKRCLAYSVLLYLVLLLDFLNLTEQVPYSLVILWYPQLVVIADLLKQLYLPKLSSHQLYELDTKSLDKEPIYQV